MIRLRNRNQIPDGIVFRQPETNFSTRPHSSFRGMVEAVVSHRLANPTHARIHGWSTDKDAVASEVDSYIAVACQAMGWNQYVMEGSADPPRPKPLALPGRVGQGLSVAASGSETIIHWLASGAEAVPLEQAAKRAAVCADCPNNGNGDWTRIFTVPVSEAIRKADLQRQEWKLETPHDDKLGICEKCDCPLKLKVHMPVNIIVDKMKPEVLHKLPEDICWIRKEIGK